MACYSHMRSIRLPSYLRRTTRECVHLVTPDNFRSRDKDVGHTIRSAIAENRMVNAKFIVRRIVTVLIFCAIQTLLLTYLPMFYRTGVTVNRSLTLREARIGIFDLLLL